MLLARTVEICLGRRRATEQVELLPPDYSKLQQLTRCIRSSPDWLVKLLLWYVLYSSALFVN
jgi:hypothetical protein